ncbi:MULTISPECIES: hypothetical protein [unclassified Ruegeria]|uniref:hypothetical protein n=1 Tax=unclassified Ruegeria TaxID=2625375 RepID=UPI001487EAF8|nr:hypothetical protein [Ruegeria sp. HKCCD8929]
MKPQTLPLLAALALAIPAVASAQTADANGDGVLTIDEVQAVFPEIDAEGFANIDVNGDGSLDQEEVTAAQEAGLMPATDG